MGVIERLKSCNYISKIEKKIFKDKRQNKSEKSTACAYEKLS